MNHKPNGNKIACNMVSIAVDVRAIVHSEVYKSVRVGVRKIASPMVGNVAGLGVRSAIKEFES